MRPLLKLCLAVVFASAALAGGPAQATSADDTIIYRLYLIQDRTRTVEAARSIEYGVRAALADVDPASIIPGKHVSLELVIRDHRTNVYQAKRLYNEFAKDDAGLVHFADVHSPPLIRHRDYLNRNGVLTLVPWAAGAPITRAPTGENWIFRLSVDDRKAGSKIANFAIQTRRCDGLHFVMLENAWGRANARTLREGLSRHNRTPSTIQWFPWGASEREIQRIVDVLVATPQDCVIYVGGEREGVWLAKALTALPDERRPTVLSHWGLATGNFAAQIPYELRERLKLRFIQSCHDLLDDRAAVAQALDRLRRVSGDADWATAAIPAPPGFVHAYDLGLILIQAMRQAKLTGDARADRQALRAALRDLTDPVEGLVKTYHRPFSPYTPSEPDAHEALTQADLCMATFAADNTIRVVRDTSIEAVQ